MTEQFTKIIVHHFRGRLPSSHEILAPTHWNRFVFEGEEATTTLSFTAGINGCPMLYPVESVDYRIFPRTREKQQSRRNPEMVPDPALVIRSSDRRGSFTAATVDSYERFVSTDKFWLGMEKAYGSWYYYLAGQFGNREYLNGVRVVDLQHGMWNLEHGVRSLNPETGEGSYDTHRYPIDWIIDYSTGELLSWPTWHAPRDMISVS